ncbi:class IIb bacteriocin, lactobin A/cerein 7B family [Alkalihalobacterium sp. APHAB7]|uniref:class IIb bacteriocin, lactobin A/cerein 7B family n=1 Tax=Alkalihalobacterium sp. APHAB7 TaxID=3402081 RepID=UPI003AAB2638
MFKEMNHSELSETNGGAAPLVIFGIAVTWKKVAVATGGAYAVGYAGGQAYSHYQNTK